MFYKGQVIGIYNLIECIGRGGFGEVWLAERQTKIVTTKVAIKLPFKEQIDYETVKHEATIWEKASGHPNVLPIIEANEYDGQLVIVTEYASDGTLELLLQKSGKLDIMRSLELTIGILSGLDFLHSRKIIHCDLKPANILLQGQTPRLADFGISRVMKTTSTSANMLGTPLYMAPEAFDKKRTKQTDIWSVGVVLYQLLEGRLPFPSSNITDLLGAIIMGEPYPFSISVAPRLSEIVGKALKKDTDERYKSANEMRIDLVNFILETSRQNAFQVVSLQNDDGSLSENNLIETQPSPTINRQIFEPDTYNQKLHSFHSQDKMLILSQVNKVKFISKLFSYKNFIILVGLFIVVIIGTFLVRKILYFNESITQTNTNQAPPLTAPEQQKVQAEIYNEDLWKIQKEKITKLKSSPVNSRKGLIIPKELYGDSVVKQKSHLHKLIQNGFVIPLDFFDIIKLKNDGTLVELPLATNDYYVEQLFFYKMSDEIRKGEFTPFEFNKGVKKIALDSAKYKILQELASNFDGKTYNINLLEDREVIRLRLLKMLRPNAKMILENLAKEYRLKYNHPLNITALTHPVDYYIKLNKVNVNSYKIKDRNSLPPHSSGCVFDINYLQMTVEEQNFLMGKIAELEQKDIVDGLIEFHPSYVIHVFVYHN